MLEEGEATPPPLRLFARRQSRPAGRS